jgi:competence protein ComEA
MRVLVWEMMWKRISSQQIGLSILILILLGGCMINKQLSFQGVLGPLEREDEIVIQVTGMVKNPGVYVFDREPSLDELVDRAGGLEEKVRGEAWSGSSCVAHGTRVHISPEHGYLKVSCESIPATYKITLEIPISLNRASQDELIAIPEIGPVLARNIIDYRNHYGLFTSVEEVQRVPGVGKFRYTTMRPFVTI